jgi:hypothetical protein
MHTSVHRPPGLGWSTIRTGAEDERPVVVEVEVTAVVEEGCAGVLEEDASKLVPTSVESVGLDEEEEMAAAASEAEEGGRGLGR